MRYRGDFLEVDPSKVNYMDVSPKQLVSVAAGLIPFLEHDDANRALMGSNMQRQGVPLIVSRCHWSAPVLKKKLRAIHTLWFWRSRAARSLQSWLIKLSSRRTAICPRAKRVKTDSEAGIHVYELRKFMRSNAGTCVNQKPIVRKGQHVKRGQVIADGPNTDRGELALGRNVLVAFMPWNGYNFEDAIMISEKVVKEDIYTSIHIDEFEIGARDTKLGPEEIYARHSQCKRRGFTQPGSGRRRAGRCGGEARRYLSWENYTEERDGTGSGRAAASRHLWRESRRCGTRH